MKNRRQNTFVLGEPGKGEERRYITKKDVMNMFGDKLLDEQNTFVFGNLGASEMMNEFKDCDIINIVPTKCVSNKPTIEVCETSDIRINPLDISFKGYEHPLIQKREFMYSFFEILKNDDGIMRDIEKEIISRCLSIIYEKYLSTQNEDDTPTLKELYDCLLNQPEKEAQMLAEHLKMHLNGMFSEKTNVDTKNRNLIFDFSKVDKNLKSISLLVSLELIWKKVMYNASINRRTILNIHEMFSMFENRYLCSYLCDLWKQARKLNCSIIGRMTSDVDVQKFCLCSDKLIAIIENSEFVNTDSFERIIPKVE